jgi:iron complex transport system substrate-binding protein
VRAISNASTGKTVAFFYLNANGAAVVRRPGEYVTKMIEMAGGAYAFDGLEAASVGSSSVTMEMEQFYAMAKDADVVIYNASTVDAVSSLVDLVQRNELLADFEAVRSGNVWVCDENMYQQMISSGSIIADLNRVLVDGAETTTYFKKLT